MTFEFDAPGAPLPLDVIEALDSLPGGSRVLLHLSSVRALGEALLACWKRDLTATPLPHDATPAQRHEAVRQLDPTIVVGDEGPVSANPGAVLCPAGSALIMFTSGSTGGRKGVLLSRTAVGRNAAHTSRLHGFAPGDPHLTALPLFHCNALVMSLIGSYETGSPLVVQYPFDPQVFFNEAERVGATTASVIPPLLERLLAARPAWPARLRYLITAAAPLRQDVAAAFYATYGPKLRQGYGMTELVNFSFVAPEMDDATFRSNYLDDWPPVGTAVPGTEVRIIDGEVQIRTEDRMEGYWQDDDAMAAALDADGWLRTGDIGSFRGDLLVLRGRTKDLINRGGEVFSPQEVEAEWRRTGAPADVLAVAVPSDYLGDEVGLWSSRIELSTIERLDELPPRFRPAAVANHDLLLTSTGKTQRRQMGERLVADSEPPERYLNLLAAARSTAQIVCRTALASAAPAFAVAVHRSAKRLLDADLGDLPALRSDLMNPAIEALDLLGDRWTDLVDGRLTGADLMRSVPGLWERLMCEWPMGAYAEMVARFIERSGAFGDYVLEVGAGVRKTSRLLAGVAHEGLAWTDPHPKLFERLYLPGASAALDFDRPPYATDFDLIIGVNCLHCSADPGRTIQHLAAGLRPGGVLLLGEGQGPTTDGRTPWALDLLFSLFDGWWDVGGFRSRAMWLEDLEVAGFSSWGYGRLRSGRHDLGGILWGTR